MAGAMVVDIADRKAWEAAFRVVEHRLFAYHGLT